jgi:hypothetical protein
MESQSRTNWPSRRGILVIHKDYLQNVFFRESDADEPFELDDMMSACTFLHPVTDETVGF